ncbi:MAG: sulfatase-like hydrolase/transferase [Planctomycetota bacterium]
MHKITWLSSLTLALPLAWNTPAIADHHAEKAAPPTEQPNIVMIFTDDQRYDAVGYAGNHAVHTPHLDRIARQGIIFDNAFVNTSICAVSRANIMAGQYPSRHGIDDFFKVFSDEQLARTVPARLQAAGYQTSFYGKWGIGDQPKPTNLGAKVFDYWAGQPMQTNFFYESDCKFVNSDGFEKPVDNLCDCPADSKGRTGFRNRIGTANLVDPLHSDSQVTPIHTERFLDNRDPSKPFAMMVFFKAPHSPFGDWDPQFEHVTDGLTMPTPAAASLEIANAEPDIIKGSLGRPSGMSYLTRPDVLDQHLRDYYRLITSLDHGVGQIMQQLEDRGLLENTVVMFTSDNGHFKGEHGMAGKWLMYDPSHRVPGFLTDFRRPVGETRHEKVITTDFSVTMLALAGLDIPEDMTGRDLTALLDGPVDDWRTDVYYDHPYGHNGAIPRTIGVRNERYAYTRYIDPTPAFEQLFDMELDPNQRVNLAEDPAYAELLEAMRKRCDELKKEVGPMASTE